jgi:subtilisin family serine protease
VSGTTNGLSTACSALPGGSLLLEIALVSRGTCTFSTKIREAQNAGAAAVLVVNNLVGDPVAMAQDGTPNQPTVPAYMVDERVAGVTLRQSNGLPATIGAHQRYFVTTNGDIMAAFSSQGPTDVDFRVKPDVVAPGVNVLSSIPHTACSAPPCWAFFQGTSMATPHLAGTVAVVRAQHPDWTAAEVRSAVVNAADQGTLEDFTTGKPVSDVNSIGAGRENLPAAAGARVALDPVSISFGAAPSGSGQTRTFDVTLTNLGSSTATFSASVGAGDRSVAYSVSGGTLTLGPRAAGAIRIMMTAVMGAVPGDHQAVLTIGSGGTTVAHAAVYTLIK